MKADTSIQAYVPSVLAQRIAQLAAQERRTMSQMIRILVEEALDARDALPDGDPAEDPRLVSAAHSEV